MNRRISLAAVPLAAAILAAGCASAASQAAAPGRPARPPSLATSLTTATGTWAVAVMGGSAASHNDFWQLFVRPAGTSTWRLATPPGVASNGGLVLTGLAGGSVLAGFRPSQDLAYSPLAITTDNGKAWAPRLLDAGLADIPGALAADPASGRLLALLTNGTTDISAAGGTAWTRLVTRQGLAASPAGTRCQLDSLTAAAFSPAGQPLLAASCGCPGTAGIFSRTGRTWQLTGPALPAAYAHQAITLTHRRAATIASAEGPWRQLPVLPPGTATLAPAPSGGWNALAVHGTQLTIWQAVPGAQSWTSAQVIKVPVQFGSSG